VLILHPETNIENNYFSLYSIFYGINSEDEFRWKKSFQLLESGENGG